MIAELNAARDNEYAEVLDRLPELRRELATAARDAVEHAAAELAAFEEAALRAEAPEPGHRPSGTDDGFAAVVRLTGLHRPTH